MKAKCKFLSLLLAVCMVFCTTPTVVLAADNVPGSVWTDYAAAEFAGGTGTEADPYQIATVEQLAKISKDVSEGTDYHGEFFKLTEDFDLSSHRWVPIGIYKWESDEDKTTTYKSFEGFIDGNNKTVSGLIVDERTDKYSAGFFGNIRNVKGGTVGAKNLIISKANIYADANGLSALQAGILAGVAMGNPGSPVIFENITVSGAIEITSNNIETDVGGMIGCGVRVKATDCNAENISVTGSNNSGGFIGIDNASVFENCTASGTVSGTWGLGGFVGYTGVATPNDPSTQSVFKNCAADVKIEGSDWRLGGFSGYAEYGEFNNCIAYGDITSTVTGWNPKVGGFIGESVNALVGNCHSTGTVISTSSDYQAGGFTGTYTGGTFTNCSFDKDKNSGLAAAGEGTISSGVEGRSSSEVLGNICEDYYGGHQYSNQWTVDTEATCAKDGSKSQRCERCGAKGNITVIPATGNHEWSVWQSNGNDTHTRTCKNCSGSQTENCTGGDATCLKKATCEGCGHEYGGFSAHELVCHEAKAATCDKDGYEAYWACDVCSKLFSDKNGTTEISQPVSIPATGHTPGTPATCTNPQTCTVCGAVLAEKLGHKAEKTEAKEPTETGAGNIAYWYCERCRKYFKDVELTQEITQEQTVLAATGKHEWGAWESNGNDTHTRTCKNCSGSQTENCTGGDATCLKKATCEVCGHEYGGFSAHELVCHEAKAATCDKDGYEAYWACNVCSKLFSDKNGTTEISQPVSIPATGHTPGTPATCTNSQTCTVCGAVLAEKLGHKAEKTEAKKPTETGAGNIAYWYCERCGKYFKDEELTQEITKEQTILAATGGTTPTDSIKDSQKIVTSKEIRKNSEKLDFKTAAGWNGKRFTLSWGKVERAEGYDIFAAPRGKKKLDAKSLVKTVKGKKTSIFLAKISKKKDYKFKIKA